MTSFFVLHSSSPSDKSRWLKIWNSWENREVFAHPSYIDLFVGANDSCLCAVFEANNQCSILFPFILRPLSDQEWCSHSSLCDLTTPYGYGGPYQLSTRISDEHLSLFWELFFNWCTKYNVVSLFSRLSLSITSLASMPGTYSSSVDNIVRSLDCDADTIWKNYAHKVRKNVQRAKKNALSVIFDSTGLHVDAFLDIYYSTMDRRQASDSYYFDREFFSRLITDLEGSFVFAHVFLEDQIISSELVLLSAHNMYSFLGGTRSDFFNLRPNDLLKHEIINWGIMNGKSNFVLGGGYQPNDGIFNYKLGFAPDGRVPFYVNHLILSPNNYQALILARSRWETYHERIWDTDTSFFPVYRA